MSNEKTKKTTTAKKTETKDTVKASEAKAEDKIIDIEKKPLKTRKTRRKLPLDMLVEVTNGYAGKLNYVSKKNAGYSIVFDSFGQKDEMELGELVSARNSQKRFFTDNWFLIDDVEVLEYLNVAKFYENSFTAENFDNIFEMSEDEILKVVPTMTTGQKNTLIYRTKQLVEEGKLDSLKTIDALEKALETEIIER